MTHPQGLFHIESERISIFIHFVAQDLLKDDAVVNPVRGAHAEDGDDGGAEPAEELHDPLVGTGR